MKVLFYGKCVILGHSFQMGSILPKRESCICKAYLEISRKRQADMILYVKELGKLKSSCLLLDLMMLSGFTLRIASQPEVCSSYFVISFIAS